MNLFRNCVFVLTYNYITYFGSDTYLSFSMGSSCRVGNLIFSGAIVPSLTYLAALNRKTQINILTSQPVKKLLQVFCCMVWHVVTWILVWLIFVMVFYCLPHNVLSICLRNEQIHVLMVGLYSDSGVKVSVYFYSTTRQFLHANHSSTSCLPHPHTHSTK